MWNHEKINPLLSYACLNSKESVSKSVSQLKIPVNKNHTEGAFGLGYT